MAETSRSFEIAKGPCLTKGFVWEGRGGFSRPAIGFGHRTELDSFAIDVSFLNVQFDAYSDYTASSIATSASLLILEGMYFVDSRANATPNFSGGFSYPSMTLNETRPVRDYGRLSVNCVPDAWKAEHL